MTYRTEKQAFETKCIGPKHAGTTLGTCRGSGCMGWQEIEETTATAVGLEPDGDGWEKTYDIGVGGAVTHKQHWKRKVGYCGLVGRPWR